MRREKSGADELLDTLAIAPTWFGPVLAAVAFPALRYLVPAVISIGKDNPMASVGVKLLSDLSRVLAPIASAFILLVWVIAEIKKRTDRRRLDKTDTVHDIRRMSWHEFELLAAEAFRRSGYAVEETGGAVADGGVDLVLYKDGEQTLVQCKHWRDRQVGVRVVRELYGVMHDQGATRGMVVCFGEFSQEAQDFAERNGIELMGGRELHRLIHEVKSPAREAQDGERAKTGAVATKRSAAPWRKRRCVPCARAKWS